MSLIDVIILIIVSLLVIFLSYYIFFRKDKSQCCECSVMISAKRKSKGIKKFYEKQKRKNLAGE